MRGSQPKPNSFSRCRGVAVPRLQQRHDVLVEVRPPPVGRACVADVTAERRVGLAERRHRQIAGQDVVERRDVGRSLNRGVAAQRENAAAGPADVAEQQLQDRGGADDLHAGRVLRQADGVADRAGAFGSGGAAERVGDPQERIARARRTPLRPSPACSARSAASGSETRSADAEASGRARSSPARRHLELPADCRRRRPCRLGASPSREQAIEILGSAKSSRR